MPPLDDILRQPREVGRDRPHQRQHRIGLLDREQPRRFVFVHSHDSLSSYRSPHAPREEPFTTHLLTTHDSVLWFFGPLNFALPPTRHDTPRFHLVEPFAPLPCPSVPLSRRPLP